MSSAIPAWRRLPPPSRLVSLLGDVEQLVEGLRRLRRIEARPPEELLVPEEGERAHRGGHGVVLAVHLHLLRRAGRSPARSRPGKQLRRQGLEELRLQVVLEPAVEELHHVGPLPGRDRGGDLQPEVVVRDVGVLDLDGGIRRLEALDELVDRLDALGEGVLPVLDLHGLRGGRASRTRASDQRLPRSHLPIFIVRLLVWRTVAGVERIRTEPGGRCSQSARAASTHALLGDWVSLLNISPRRAGPSELLRSQSSDP